MILLVRYRTSSCRILAIMHWHKTCVLENLVLEVLRIFLRHYSKEILALRNEIVDVLAWRFSTQILSTKELNFGIVLDHGEIKGCLSFSSHVDQVTNLFYRGLFHCETSEDKLSVNHFYDSICLNECCKRLCETFCSGVFQNQDQNRLLLCSRRHTNLGEALSQAFNSRYSLVIIWHEFIILYKLDAESLQNLCTMTLSDEMSFLILIFGTPSEGRSKSCLYTTKKACKHTGLLLIITLCFLFLVC